MGKQRKAARIALGKKLAELNPNSLALKAAREWWSTGCLYSNHDFDVWSAVLREVFELTGEAYPSAHI